MVQATLSEGGGGGGSNVPEPRIPNNLCLGILDKLWYRRPLSGMASLLIKREKSVWPPRPSIYVHVTLILIMKP